MAAKTTYYGLPAVVVGRQHMQMNNNSNNSRKIIIIIAVENTTLHDSHRNILAGRMNNSRRVKSNLVLLLLYRFETIQVAQVKNKGRSFYYLYFLYYST
jgi:hypothetical protein